MSIVITPGEKALIEEFNNRNVEIVIENLLVGDIHIRDEKGQQVYIFERKAKGDLEASIKDGRYKEQKNRLIETGLPRRQIIYLIEQLTKPRLGPAHTRIWSAMCHSIHRDGFSVFCTKNIAETADYLIGMAAAVGKFPVYSDGAEDNNVKAAAVNVNIKKKQVSANEWYAYTLTLIPSVSMNIAQVIVREYPTLTALKDAFKEHGPGLLANLKHGASQRRIGDKLSAVVHEYIIQALM